MPRTPPRTKTAGIDLIDPDNSKFDNTVGIYRDEDTLKFRGAVDLTSGIPVSGVIPFTAHTYFKITTVGGVDKLQLFVNDTLVQEFGG